ncbi:MAG: hypothetical protein JRJ15_07755 [Deltaproteobacteria bacterium]|nr:hypothetical protein [Deltaproteobacteria bacterium]
MEVSFEKATNIYGAFNDGTVALKFLRCSLSKSLYYTCHRLCLGCVQER